MVQIASNTLVSFCHLLILGLGLGLIYRTTRFLDISFAGTVSCGCYTLYLGIVVLAHSWIFALVLSLGLAVGLALILHRFILCALRTPNNSLRTPNNFQWSLLVASLGIFVVLQNVLAIVFGNDLKPIWRGRVEVGYHMLGVYLTDAQLLTMTVGGVLFITMWLLLKHTRLGRSIRGIASDADLCRIFGIDVRRTRLWAVGTGTALGTIAGILSALDTGLVPTLGFRLLLNGLIVMIIGGVGPIGGLIGGAFLLAAAQNLTAYYLGSRWMEAVSFLILIAFLIWKPLGFSGQRLKKVAV